MAGNWPQRIRPGRGTSGERIIIDIEVVCPLSGLTVEDGTIPSHKMVVIVLPNGSMYCRCGTHFVRMFCADERLISKIRRAYGVKEVVTYNVPKKPV